jgi:hypothetical protein
LTCVLYKKKHKIILITEIEYGHVPTGIYIASGFLTRGSHEVLLKWPGEREYRIKESEMKQVLYEKYVRNHSYYGLTVMKGKKEYK